MNAHITPEKVRDCLVGACVSALIHVPQDKIDRIVASAPTDDVNAMIAHLHAGLAPHVREARESRQIAEYAMHTEKVPFSGKTGEDVERYFDDKEPGEKMPIFFVKGSDFGRICQDILDPQTMGGNDLRHAVTMAEARGYFMFVRNNTRAMVQVDRS